MSLISIAGQVDCLVHAHELLLHEPPSPQVVSEMAGRLADHHTLGEELLAVVSSPRYRERLGREMAPDATERDEEWLEHVYLKLLDRGLDAGGSEYFGGQLRAGRTRADVVTELAACDEHVHRIVAGIYPLPNLRVKYPDQYVDAPSRGGSTPCVHARTASELAWVSEMIMEADYYDRPGIWSWAVDTDKRVMAEVIAELEPESVLELGCASGAMLGCLHALGIPAQGVELSATAARQATPEVRDAIHVGDVLDLDLRRTYDVVVGLDIFEHVTPTETAELFRAAFDLVRPGGYLVANIPAFGEDRIFGTVFDTYVDDWEASATRMEPFRVLHVDDNGFPLHGHLTWAATNWWEHTITDAGFVRETGIEAALHRRYGAHFASETPSRAAFYVFANDPLRRRARRIARRVTRDRRPLPH